jgi:hypothetical protein
MAIAATFTSLNNGVEYDASEGNSQSSSSSYSRSSSSYSLVAGDMIATFFGANYPITGASVGTQQENVNQTVYASLVTNTGTGVTSTTITINNGGASHRRISYRMNLIGDLMLPINLLSFNATYQKTKQVRLNWSTASETNNDFFTIQRSRDGMVFENVATVKGAGNSTVLQNYVAFDESPYEGVSYYRLKQTDYDGNCKYSDWVAVNHTASDPLNVYPNPVIDQLNYVINAGEDGYFESELLDASGKMISSKKDFLSEGIQTLSHDFSALPPGTYMLRVRTKDEVYYRKIVK